MRLYNTQQSSARGVSLFRPPTLQSVPVLSCMISIKNVSLETKLLSYVTLNPDRKLIMYGIFWIYLPTVILICFITQDIHYFSNIWLSIMIESHIKIQLYQSIDFNLPNMSRQDVAIKAAITLSLVISIIAIIYFFPCCSCKHDNAIIV